MNKFMEINRTSRSRRPVSERLKDYKDIYGDISEQAELQEQASRCMQCGTPFCNYRCPLGNLIPELNILVYQNKWRDAAERLLAYSPFPEISARVCPALCEDGCTLGINRSSISIRDLELSIIEKAFQEGWISLSQPRLKTGKKIAIVGSGPAGLAAASDLNAAGHSVTVYEKDNTAGGMLRYGIPDFKLEKNIVERRLKILTEEGIEFKYAVNIGQDITMEELQSRYDAVLLATGYRKENDLVLPGRNLKGIHTAMEYLTRQNMVNAGVLCDQINAKGKQVIIIGGGDTAADCAGTALRQQAASVTMLEIMPEPKKKETLTEEWPFYPAYRRYSPAEEEGAALLFSTAAREFSGRDNHVTNVTANKVEWISDETGRKTIDQEAVQFSADMVILALGFCQSEPISSLINQTPKGTLAADQDGNTGIKGIFAAGDAVNGATLVSTAIYDGLKAAESINKFLSK